MPGTFTLQMGDGDVGSGQRLRGELLQSLDFHLLPWFDDMFVIFNILSIKVPRSTYTAENLSF